jgi:hypothetical protein
MTVHSTASHPAAMTPARPHARRAPATPIVDWGNPGVFIPKSGPDRVWSFESLLRRYPIEQTPRRPTAAAKAATKASPKAAAPVTTPATQRPVRKSMATPPEPQALLPPPRVESPRQPTVKAPRSRPGSPLTSKAQASSAIVGEPTAPAPHSGALISERAVRVHDGAPLRSARNVSPMPIPLPNALVPSPLHRSDFRTMTDENRRYIKCMKTMHRAGIALTRAAQAGFDLLRTHFLGRLVGVVKFAVSSCDLAASLAVQLPVAALVLARRVPAIAHAVWTDDASRLQPASTLFKARPLIGAAWSDLKAAAGAVVHGVPRAAPAEVRQSASARPSLTARTVAESDAIDAVRQAHRKASQALRKVGFNLAACTFTSRFLTFGIMAAGVGITLAATVATGGIAPLALAGLVVAGLSVRLAAANAWCAFQNARLTWHGQPGLPMGASAIANAVYGQLQPRAEPPGGTPARKQDFRTDAQRLPQDAEGLRQHDLRARTEATGVVATIAVVQVAAGLSTAVAGQLISGATALMTKVLRWSFTAVQGSLPALEQVAALRLNGGVRAAELEVLQALHAWAPQDLTREAIESDYQALVAELDAFGLDANRLLLAVAQGQLTRAEDLTAWFKDAQVKAAGQASNIVWQAANAITVDRGLVGILAG